MLREERLENSMEILLTEVIEEDADLLSEEDFLAAASSPVPTEPSPEFGKAMDEKPKCICCKRSDRPLWSGICAWCGESCV